MNGSTVFADYQSGNGSPVFADYQSGEVANSLNLLAPPDNRLSWMLSRYLLQKAISVFEWTLPPTWDKDYFLYCLYCFGRVAIINTDRFGIIPQACGLMGYNVFYRPTRVIITNALIRNTLMPEIGKTCVVMKLQPDYGGIMDLVRYYANLLAQAAQSVGVSLTNSKAALFFMVRNKASADAFKKGYDEMTAGKPAVIFDKTMFDDDGAALWDTVQRNPRDAYIVTELLRDMRTIESMFDTDIGIPNANTEKRERLITDEVNANNVETYSKCALWLEQLRESCAEARDMFGINISVDWRKDILPTETKEALPDAV